MTKEPIVFLLDLDGTLQGDVSPQVVEYELVRKLNQRIQNNSKKIKYDPKFLYKDFANGLIRPYVKEALMGIKARHPNVEFFVYTASSDEWAKFLLPHIVKYLFGKEKIINRPFFTRNHCEPSGKKSIAKIKPLIKRALSSRYSDAQYRHIYLVDNNFVLGQDELNKLLYCPTYNYKCVNCPMRNLTDEHLESFHDLISKNLFNVPTINKVHLFKVYYDNAFKEYVHTEERNKQYANDQYWKIFCTLVIKNKLACERDIHKLITKLRMLSVHMKQI